VIGGTNNGLRQASRVIHRAASGLRGAAGSAVDNPAPVAASRTTLHEERVDLQKRLEIDHRRVGTFFVPTLRFS